VGGLLNPDFNHWDPGFAESNAAVEDASFYQAPEGIELWAEHDLSTDPTTVSTNFGSPIEETEEQLCYGMVCLIVHRPYRMRTSFSI
jgi:hypothetical protein